MLSFLGQGTCYRKLLWFSSGLRSKCIDNIYVKIGHNCFLTKFPQLQSSPPHLVHELRCWCSIPVWCAGSLTHTQPAESQERSDPILRLGELKLLVYISQYTSYCLTNGISLLFRVPGCRILPAIVISSSPVLRVLLYPHPSS
jgi:hypothetical protein